ncbi:MAG: mechanosensitive ion channel family protein [Acidimicrobiales bacterium]
MRAQTDPTALQNACGDDPGFWCEQVFDWTGNAALAALANWLLDVPLRIAIIVLIAVVANRLVRRAVRRLTDRIATDTQPDTPPGWIRKAPALIVPGTPSVRSAARARTVGGLLRSLASIVISTIAGMLILAELNINLAPLIASAGIAGVALGFGAQSLVRDFISGIFMMIEDQYGVGDVVDLGDAVGTVEHITLRVTRLRDVNGTLWFVPNGQVLRVANKSRSWGRAVIDIPVVYGTVIERAQAVISSVAETLAADDGWKDKVLEPPEVWGVEKLASDAITIRLVAKTDPAAVPEVQRELRRRIVEAFDAEGIEMPHPVYPPPPPAPSE